MDNLIRLPQKFFDDHVERDLDTPEIVKANKRFYYVRDDDPHLPELLSDAKYYAAVGDDESCYEGLQGAAVRLMKALTDAGVEVPARKPVDDEVEAATDEDLYDISVARREMDRSDNPTRRRIIEPGASRKTDPNYAWLAYGKG